ncbi:class I adenylate-forming enzyme family protein [Quatrionicoccus australiensis]|uniref:class I adenylate-forming enzyme family protein n=1 Tax=Quatrionicoccus australiensis TaxID=138118 RepID=UPI001CF8A4F0|nr:class I adenylate-forming enzyme family protein [Quatrionicoccus australiensis]UCV15723.1 acyl--CoA ligase [Quatrionicoccus australiensis]
MNVADLLARQAVKMPHATAVIQAERILSFAEFDALVWGLCRCFRENGLLVGDVVGVHVQNPLLHLATILALARSGMVSVAISTLGSDGQASRNILLRAAVSAVIDDAGSLNWGCQKQINLDPVHALNLQGEHDESLRVDLPNARMMLRTSSGTTGLPKIVEATHASMIASIRREIACIGYPVGERYLTPVALQFDGPRRRYLSCLASGATAVMPSGVPSFTSLFALIDQHDIRHFSCVPSQAYQMALSVPPGKQRFPQMRCFRLSAGPSEAQLHQFLRERLTPNICISYGCTELGPLTVAKPDLVTSKPQSVGYAMPGIELEIVSANDDPVPAGAVGIVRLRTEGMPAGYLGDPAATEKYFRNGWFYPGDLGSIAEDGLVFHLGRADDMMIMNGVNIYPAEIEQAMMSHPAVVDAVAMPLKHKVVNDIPVCVLALGAGQALSEQELLVFARRRLESHSPKRIFVLDEIPRNEHGKVKRPELIQTIVSRLQAET